MGIPFILWAGAWIASMIVWVIALDRRRKVETKLTEREQRLALVFEVGPQVPVFPCGQAG